MRNLESTRPGRIFQGIGWFLVCYALGDAAACIITPHAWPWAFFNILTLSGGLYIVFGPGRRMVRGARDHKAFMDAHRARMAALQSRWN